MALKQAEGEEREAAWEEALDIAKEGDQQEDWKKAKSKGAVQDVLSLFGGARCDICPLLAVLES